MTNPTNGNDDNAVDDYPMCAYNQCRKPILYPNDLGLCPHHYQRALRLLKNMPKHTHKNIRL